MIYLKIVQLALNNNHSPNPNPIQGIYHVTSYYYNNISYLYIFFTSFFFKMSVSDCCLTPIEQFLNISW
jgi:hypothetical protein